MNRGSTDPSLRGHLIGILEENAPEASTALRDDTSLIRSGLIDSMALFNLAVWIEKETGTRLDLETFDPSVEWDTITDILDFIGKRRRGGPAG